MALVECGCYEEGKALLAPLAALDQANSIDSFMSLAFLAIADHRLGNAAAARRLADAVGTVPHVTEMLARFDREIPRAE